MIKSIKNTNKERKIIGLNTNKIAPNNSHYVPLSHIVKTRVTNDLYGKLKEKCEVEWENCTSVSNCNKVLDINQRNFDGKEITESEKKFIVNNLEDSIVKNFNDCFIKNYDSIQTNSTSEPVQITPTNTSDIQTNTISNYQPIALYPLFKNNEELNNFSSTFIYKIIKFIDSNDITTIYREVNKGLSSLEILDNNYNTNTKIKLIGGDNDGKIFYNRKLYIPLYNSLEEINSPIYIYHKLNKHEIIGTEDYLSIKELYDLGMTTFDNKSLSFDINANFVISGGEYNGKIFKNKIDEIIEKGVLCNLFYNLPIIGHPLCAYNDYSLFLIGFIIIIIVLIVIIIIFYSKSNKIVKSNKLIIKKQTTSQK